MSLHMGLELRKIEPQTKGLMIIFLSTSAHMLFVYDSFMSFKVEN